MKVLDLQCAQHHVFEGWFGSEDDYQSQLTRGLLTCPMCGDASVSKKLSAPRLNLSTARGDRAAAGGASHATSEISSSAADVSAPTSAAAASGSATRSSSSSTNAAAMATASRTRWDTRVRDVQQEQGQERIHRNKLAFALYAQHQQAEAHRLLNNAGSVSTYYLLVFCC